VLEGGHLGFDAAAQPKCPGLSTAGNDLRPNYFRAAGEGISENTRNDLIENADAAEMARRESVAMWSTKQGKNQR